MLGSAGSFSNCSSTTFDEYNLKNKETASPSSTATPHKVSDLLCKTRQLLLNSSQATAADTEKVLLSLPTESPNPIFWHSLLLNDDRCMAEILDWCYERIIFYERDPQTASHQRLLRIIMNCCAMEPDSIHVKEGREEQEFGDESCGISKNESLFASRLLDQFVLGNAIVQREDSPDTTRSDQANKSPSSSSLNSATEIAPYLNVMTQLLAMKGGHRFRSHWQQHDRFQTLQKFLVHGLGSVSTSSCTDTINSSSPSSSSPLSGAMTSDELALILCYLVLLFELLLEYRDGGERLLKLFHLNNVKQSLLLIGFCFQRQQSSSGSSASVMNLHPVPIKQACRLLQLFLSNREPRITQMILGGNAKNQPQLMEIIREKIVPVISLGTFDRGEAKSILNLMQMLVKVLDNNSSLKSGMGELLGRLKEPLLFWLNDPILLPSCIKLLNFLDQSDVNPIEVDHSSSTALSSGWWWKPFVADLMALISDPETPIQLQQLTGSQRTLQILDLMLDTLAHQQSCEFKNLIPMLTNQIKQESSMKLNGGGWHLKLDFCRIQVLYLACGRTLSGNIRFDSLIAPFLSRVKRQLYQTSNTASNNNDNDNVNNVEDYNIPVFETFLGCMEGVRNRFPDLHTSFVNILDRVPSASLPQLKSLERVNKLLVPMVKQLIKQLDITEDCNEENDEEEERLIEQWMNKLNFSH